MEGIQQISGRDRQESFLFETTSPLSETGSRTSHDLLQGEAMRPFNYFIKYWKADAVIQRTVTAFTKMEALEQLGITDSDIIEFKVIDGI